MRKDQPTQFQKLARYDIHGLWLLLRKLITPPVISSCDQHVLARWVLMPVIARLVAFSYRNSPKDHRRRLAIDQDPLTMPSTPTARHIKTVLQMIGHITSDALSRRNSIQSPSRLRFFGLDEPCRCFKKSWTLTPAFILALISCHALIRRQTSSYRRFLAALDRQGNYNRFEQFSSSTDDSAAGQR